MVQAGKRRGSIPMVLGMTLVLATLGAAAITMTGTLNRTDRRADLGRKASDVARLASEEALVKLMNGSASWGSGDGKTGTRTLLPASATQALYDAQGIRVEPVEVMGRPLEEKGVDAAARDDFYGILSAGPFFARNHDPKWDEKKLEPRIQALMAPPAGVKPDLAKRDELVQQLANQLPDSDDEVAIAFKAADQPGGGDTGLQEDLAKAGEKVGEAAVDASCGNLAPEAALVSVMSSLTRNRTLDVDSDEFERLQDLAEAGGILRKTDYLLTLQSKASAPAAGMESSSTHVTHRMASRLYYGEAMRFVYGRMLGYIHAHLGLTYDDFQRLGMIDAMGEIRAERIMPAVEAQFTMRPGPQIWPFPVATGPAVSSSGGAAEVP